MEKPKIGIFTRPIDQGTSGSGSHLEQLVNHIVKLNSNYHIVFIHYDKSKKHDLYDNFESIIIPRNPLKASKILRKEKFSLLHYSPLTVFAPLWIPHVKKVATIHGAAPLSLPDQYKKTTVLHDKYIRPILVKFMDYILTVSQTSKKYLVRDCKFPEDRIAITYNAVDSDFKRQETKSIVINNYRFNPEKNRYLFHLSKYSERKNPKVILDSFKHINKEDKEIVLILGGKGWENRDVLDFLHDNQLENNVLFPGFMTRQEIMQLLSLSSAFIFPSYYEGFGMPNIEAMACGCPVITSNAFAIPEIVGDAAVILKDNTDSHELCSKVFDVINNKELAQELVNKGYIRSKDFSWNKSAEVALSIYDKCITEGNKTK
jgi:glycosyltransferase involved in cell wall biosynthesis